MPNDALFQTLDVAEVQRNLPRLLQQIACDNGRVEIRNNDGTCDCVLISKAELQSLEDALEILAHTDGYQAMRSTIAQVSAAAGQVPGLRL